MRPSSPERIAVKKQATCVSCGEINLESYISLKLYDHCYCDDCANSWVTASLEPSSAFPPVCCGNNITLEVFRNHLPPDLADQFIRKEQSNSQQPAHCSVPKLAVDNIVGSKGRCSACNRYTCAKCRKSWHDHTDCAVGEERAQVIEIAKKEGWQSCYRCGNLVEPNFGCYHMT